MNRNVLRQEDLRRKTFSVKELQKRPRRAPLSPPDYASFRAIMRPFVRFRVVFIRSMTTFFRCAGI